MKRAISLLPALFLFTACPTLNEDGTTTGWLTPARVEKVSRLAAYTGFKVELIRNPVNRPTLERISTGVNELVAMQEWDVITMIAVANANGLYELTSDEAQIVLSTAPLFVDLFYNKEVDLRQVEYAQAFITGTADGFNLALSSVRTTPAGPAGPDEILAKLTAEAKASR